MKRGGRRALGPYLDPQRTVGAYSVVFHDGEGGRTAKRYSSEEEATEARIAFNGHPDRPAAGPGPVPNSRMTIYFIRAGTNALKIGITRNIGQRYATLQTASQYPLRLLLAIPGTRADERALHRMFKDERKRGEWFKPSPRLIRFIRDCEAGAAKVLTDAMEAARQEVFPVRSDGE